MEKLPSRTSSLLTGEYSDATDQLANITFKMRLEREMQNIDQFNAGNALANPAILGERLNGSLFGEGKLPRRATISGPALESDFIFLDGPLVTDMPARHLDRGEGILRGFTVVTVIADNRETRLPTLQCDSLVDERSYFFPVHMIESLEYAVESESVQIIAGTFEQELVTINDLHRMMVDDNVSVHAQRSVFRREQQRINGLLRGIIDKNEMFDFTPGFYYYFEEGEKPDLLLDNSRVDCINQLFGEVELHGKFIGFSMPLLMQSDIVEQKGDAVHAMWMDPYESCALFYNDDTKNVYAVPYDSLQKLV